jgi:glyceraldehyde 3-phosphate dehydrogenase
MSETISIGINGFGRVGRSVLFASLSNPAVRVTAINDPFISTEYAAYLIKHDTSTGGFRGSVEVRKDNSIVVDGNIIAVTQRSEPSSIPWGESRVTYVIECSGVHTTHDRAAAHLAGGALRVVIAAPSSDAATLVQGVNVDSMKPTAQVISAGSCTGMVLCAILRFLGEKFGIEECSYTAIHAATPTQKIVDGANGKEWRSARSALSNIIPHSCGAAKTVQKVLPQIANKVIGSSVRVPVQNGCALDVTVRLTNGVSKEALDLSIQEGTAVGSPYYGILASTNEEIVSADVTDSPASIYDSKASVSLNSTTHKLLWWYSHELGYSHRLLQLIIQTNATW